MPGAVGGGERAGAGEARRQRHIASVHARWVGAVWHARGMQGLCQGDTSDDHHHHTSTDLSLPCHQSDGTSARSPATSGSHLCKKQASSCPDHLCVLMTVYATSCEAHIHNGARTPAHTVTHTESGRMSFCSSSHLSSAPPASHHTQTHAHALTSLLARRRPRDTALDHHPRAHRMKSR